MPIATLALVLLAVAAAAAARQSPAPPPRADLWIDVTATGAGDRPVADLRPDEFEVWIVGYRIPITDVVVVTPGSPAGRTLVIVLDDAAVPPVLGPKIREAARMLVERMGPADRIAVMHLNDARMELTNNRAQLLQRVEAYRMQGFPFRIEDAGAHVLRTFAAISRQLAEASDSRKAVVAIGAGWLFDTPLPPPGLRDLRADWIEAMRASAVAHTTLYVIDPAGVGTMRPHVGGSSGFAAETGGHAFLNTNDAAPAVERIWRETGSYYRLGIANPRVQQGADLREVEVKVRRKGVAIRSRKAIPGQRQ